MHPIVCRVNALRDIIGVECARICASYATPNGELCKEFDTSSKPYLVHPSIWTDRSVDECELANFIQYDCVLRLAVPNLKRGQYNVCVMNHLLAYLVRTVSSPEPIIRLHDSYRMPHLWCGPLNAAIHRQRIDVIHMLKSVFGRLHIYKANDYARVEIAAILTRRIDIVELVRRLFIPPDFKFEDSDLCKIFVAAVKSGSCEMFEHTARHHDAGKSKGRLSSRITDSVCEGIAQIGHFPMLQCVEKYSGRCAIMGAFDHIIAACLESDQSEFLQQYLVTFSRHGLNIRVRSLYQESDGVRSARVLRVLRETAGLLAEHLTHDQLRVAVTHPKLDLLTEIRDGFGMDSTHIQWQQFLRVCQREQDTRVLKFMRRRLGLGCDTVKRKRSSPPNRPRKKASRTIQT